MERTPTRLHRLIDRHLSRPLAELVAERRAEQIGWRAIAAEVEQATAIEVSHEALRDWFADDEAVTR